MVQSGYTPPPLGLLYLAAMDPDTVIWDAAHRPDDLDAVLDRLKPSLVGVPIYTPGRHDSLGMLARAHAYGARTVAGGPHVTIMTKQLIDHYGHFVDHFVVGDGESSWALLCKGNHGSQVMGLFELDIDLDRLPQPAWDRIDLLGYPARGHGLVRGNDLDVLPRISICHGRGCPGSCDFCSSFWVNGPYRHHSAAWMRRSLESLWNLGVRHLVFQDDCFTTDREAVLGLCDVLDQYRFSWHATTRADCFDEELARAMSRAGCYEISFGIESGSPELLDVMRKKSDATSAIKARAACREVGISFTALMIKGYPGETPETIRQDRIFLKELQPDGVGSIGETWVLPGTTLYVRCKRAGLLTDEFWLGPEPYFVYPSQENQEGV